MRNKAKRPQISHKDLLLSASEQIVRLEASINYTTFVLAGGEQKVMSYTLKIYDSLLSYPFIRVSRGCIVNRNFIEKLNATTKALLLTDGSNILISRRRWEKVRQDMDLDLK